jgi:proteic killer suppression protein
VIKSFRDRDTESLFKRNRVKRFTNIENVARRKLLAIHAAIRLQDLSAVPGNRLETLKGKRSGQHSIRINDQYRVCFVWKDGDAEQVESTDYH